MHRHAAGRWKQHQMVGRDFEADLIPGAQIHVAGEQRFQLCTGRQLQAIQGGRALKRQARNPGLDRAVGRIMMSSGRSSTSIGVPFAPG